MYNHAPEGYDCPFCVTVSGRDREDLWTKRSDVVRRTDRVTAWISPTWWPMNAGHVIVVPNEHVENIYDLPRDLAGDIHDVTREVAIALMETYGCEGTATRQHNGPRGDQEVWHYHVHVFPRYVGDGLYGAERRRTTPDERLEYAERLRTWFGRR